jgi:hypothetical protein
MPPPTLWEEELVSSRLLQYEVWNLVHYHGRTRLVEDARELLSSVSFVDMSRRVLERALAAYPVRLKTLDALHMATVMYLVSEDEEVSLASYDGRMHAAAEGLRVPLYAL